MSFERKLKEGLLGESLISQWLIKRGFQILPAYQVEYSTGKGPRLFGSYGQLISPDLLAFNTRGRIIWVEAKSKSAFTWHRASSTWQTGIDKRHWAEYIQVAKETAWPVWILFLHKDGRAKDTPDGKASPTGLFGNTLMLLEKTIHHSHDNHGPSGMVYWEMGALQKLAEFTDL